MEHRDNIDVAFPIETVKLSLDPVVLRHIVRNVGVEGDNERVAITKGVGRVSGKATLSTIGRDQLGHCLKVISQSLLSLGRIQVLGLGDVMIARRQKIWDTAFSGQTVDQTNEA